MAQKHFLSLKDWSRDEIELLFEQAAAIKATPETYARALAGRSLARVKRVADGATGDTLEAPGPRSQGDPSVGAGERC